MAGEWEKVRLGDLVKITHGWPFKSECFTEERTGRPIIVSIGNFQYTGGFRFESTTMKEYTADYPKEYELTPGDILLVRTCQTSGGEILGIPDDGKSTFITVTSEWGRWSSKNESASTPDLFTTSRFGRTSIANGA